MTPASDPEPVREDALRDELTRACFDPGIWAGPRGDRTLDQWRADACLAGPLADLIAQTATLARRLAEVEGRQLAEAFARRAHAGQTDMAGLPYTGHLGRVAARSRAHAEAISGAPEFAAMCEQAGWLHDVIEDTPLTAEHLRLAGFDPAVVRAVERLTRPDDVPYLDYVRVIIASSDPIAMVVKLADNEDNADPSRLSFGRIPPSLIDRYEHSAELLRAALASPKPPARDEESADV